jgi:RNA polymerase-binding protein DksA
MGRHDAIRSQLESRLRELRERVGQIQRDLGGVRHPDSEERAAELENDEVLERLDDAERREVEEIRAALARIGSGVYGQCARCGEAIAEGRLQALPYATLCIDCAA